MTSSERSNTAAGGAAAADEDDVDGERSSSRVFAMSERSRSGRSTAMRRAAADGEIS